MASNPFPIQFRPNVKSTINDMILKDMFGSDGDAVGKTIGILSSLPQHELEYYEFEIRFGTNDIHTSQEQWRSFMNLYSDRLVKLSDADNIVINYKPAVDVKNIYFRHNITTNTFEKKLVIFKTIQSGTSAYPATLKLSKEFVLSNIDSANEVINIQHEYRCSYKFDDAKFKYYDPDNMLSNWRIDMTLRLFSNSMNSAKITTRIDSSIMESLCYYDLLDIEFEFTGPYNLLLSSLHKLAEIIFKTHNPERITLDMVCTDILGKQDMFNFNHKQLLISSNDINNNDVSKYAISDEISGDICYIITFTNLKSHKILYIYAIFKDEIRHIYHSSSDEYHIMYVSQPTNIDISWYQAVYNDTYTLTDVYIYNSTAVNNIKFDLRMNIINNSLASINSVSKSFNKLKHTTYSDWADVMHAMNSTKSLILKPKLHDAMKEILYIMPGANNLNIKFRLHYVPIKGVFYLYVHGCASQIIRSISILNRYSIEHTGNSLIGCNPNSYYDVLFDSPFLENAFYYIPILDDVNDIEYNKDLVQRMISNPTSLNGVTIKMLRFENKWYPTKISKSRPSTYVEAIKISALIKNYYSINKTNLTITNQSINNIHSIFYNTHDSIDKYIYETIFNTRNNKSFLDIISEGCYNAKYMRAIINATLVYVVSDEQSTIDEYISSAMFTQSISPTFVERHIQREDMAFINIYALNCSFKNLLPTIARSTTYTPNSINTIFYQDMLSKFTSIIDVIKFRDVCLSLLSSNGILAMKIYDEKQIRNVIDNKSTCLDITMDEYKQSKQCYQDANTTFEKIFHTNNSTKSNAKITCNDDTIMVSYGKFKCSGQKPRICDNIKNAGLLVAYYNDKNLYRNGKFVSNKLLSKNQTINIRNILGINTEYASNVYDHLYDQWYSEYDDVDRMFGSKGNINECEILDQPILIELDLLPTDLLHKLKEARHFKYNIVIATLSEYDDLNNMFNCIVLDNDIILYIGYSYSLIAEDICILNKYIQTYVVNSSASLLFEYYKHPIAYKREYIDSNYSKISYVSNLFTGNWFNDIMEIKFKLIYMEQPMSNNAVVKHYAINKMFTNISSVEEFFKSLTYVILKPL